MTQIPPPPPSALLSSLASSLPMFKAVIKSRCGLMFDELGEKTLLTALEMRCQQQNVASAAQYLAIIQTQDDEFDRLVTHLTINETYFYREPQQIDLLLDHLLPPLLLDRSLAMGPVRILSAGCSTGEEPYSLAIALCERFGPEIAQKVTVIGGDIDRVVLDKAQHAVYGSFSFRGLSQTLQQKYFSPITRHTYQLASSIRQMVQFHPLNLLSKILPAALYQVDIIFLRNVSIYFDTETRREIQNNLRSLLRDGKGTLVVGLAETLANDLGVFSLTEHQGQFYFSTESSFLIPSALESFTPRKEPLSALFSSLPPLPTDVLLPPPPPAPPPLVPAVSHEETARRAHDLLQEQLWGQALELIRRLPLTHPQRRAWESWTCLHLRDFTTARALAEDLAQEDRWSLDALILLGCVARWCQQTDLAIESFKKALYVRPDCWVAQYYLGDLYRAQQALPLAQRNYRLALGQLSNANADPDSGCSFPLGLPLAQVRFLCQRYAGESAQK